MTAENKWVHICKSLFIWPHMTIHRWTLFHWQRCDLFQHILPKLYTQWLSFYKLVHFLLLGWGILRERSKLITEDNIRPSLWFTPNNRDRKLIRPLTGQKIGQTIDGSENQADHWQEWKLAIPLTGQKIDQAIDRSENFSDHWQVRKLVRPLTGQKIDQTIIDRSENWPDHWQAWKLVRPIELTLLSDHWQVRKLIRINLQEWNEWYIYIRNMDNYYESEL